MVHRHLLKRLWNGVVLIGRQKHVLCEIDLHAMSLAYGDRWRNLHKAIHNCRSGLRHGRSRTAGENLRAGAAVNASALGNLSRTCNDSESKRAAEDFEVVVVHLILQALLPDLI